MPYEMFADAVVRPISPRARARRRRLVFVSIALHVVLVLALVFAQALAPGVLPAPARTLAFEITEPVKVVDVPAPPRPRSAPAPAAEPLNPNAAPATAPIGIRAEPDVPIAPPDPGGSVPGAEPGFNPNANLPGIVQLAPPPAPAPQQPIRPSAGMQVPKKVVDVAPAYPPIAIAARKEGVVILEAIIDVHGNVESVRALRADPLLLDAAVDAVRQWKYTPGVLNGIAVPVIMTVTVNFKLQ